MKDYLKKNPGQVAAAIRLKRTQYKTQVFILVEGDTDKRLLRKFFDEQHTHIEIAHSKSNLLQALKTLVDEGDTKVLGIADADFDRITNNVSAQENLFLTDTHDWETTFLNSPALDVVVNEYASDDKWEAFQKQGKSLLDVLTEAGKHIGYLRLLNKKEGLMLTFEGIKNKKFVNEATLKVDIKGLIQEVKNKSQKPGLDLTQTETAMKALYDSSHPVLDICVGHDLADLLALAFFKLIGTNTGKGKNKNRSENKGKNKAQMSGSDVESYLRLAYHFSDFQRTQLFQDLKKWADDKSLILFTTT